MPCQAIEAKPSKNERHVKEESQNRTDRKKREKKENGPQANGSKVKKNLPHNHPAPGPPASATSRPHR
jgi:hypothetical protein